MSWRPIAVFPSLRRVPLGAVPRFHRYYGGAPTSPRPVGLGCPQRSFLCPTFRSLRRSPIGGIAIDGLVLGHRWTNTEFLALREGGRSPRFLDSPCTRAPLLDPGGIENARPLGVSMRPSANRRTSAPTKNISRLNDAARVLPVYASPTGSPQSAQHSVPAGGQPWPGGLLLHRAAARSFMSTSWLLLPGLAWRTRFCNDQYLRLPDRQ